MTRRSVTYTDPETGEEKVLDDVYIEPAEYFTPEALKVAEEWDRKHGETALNSNSETKAEIWESYDDMMKDKNRNKKK